MLGGIMGMPRLVHLSWKAFAAEEGGDFRAGFSRDFFLLIYRFVLEQVFLSGTVLFFVWNKYILRFYKGGWRQAYWGLHL